ncbi:hypothetical protein XA68_12448 [Ophiocordyceps unilateralis]|uniref:GH16 domain-containing protein n=1 Tax=Ophiocordyceps unilateralis TaxID=268505 RepID=A0A2A9PDB7_OPHUN|nr:hypothetical protein XA68_12448 [Ophiocordyceps unilateralis]
MALANLATLLLLTSSVAAHIFTLEQNVNGSNFYDEFEFLTKGRNPAEPYDDNKAWVRYQALASAQKKNLTRIEDDGQIYLGVDHTTVLGSDTKGGRDTFKVQTRYAYNQGLFIMRFSHMPKPVCGAWPAFWTVGDGEWPLNGEVDLYEGWNLNTANRPSFHAGKPSEVGNCTLESELQGADIISENCDNSFELKPAQPVGQGCQVNETRDGIWGSPEGGIQALVWTNEEVKVYTWPHSLAPSNLDDKTIDTSTWGTPSLHLRKPSCHVDEGLRNHRFILNIAFCGGLQWGEGPGGPSCLAKTQQSCEAYVAQHPADFRDVFFRIKDFRYFSLQPAESTVRSGAKRSLVRLVRRQAEQRYLLSNSSSMATSGSAPPLGVSSSTSLPQLPSLSFSDSETARIPQVEPTTAYKDVESSTTQTTASSTTSDPSSQPDADALSSNSMNSSTTAAAAASSTGNRLSGSSSNTTIPSTDDAVVAARILAKPSGPNHASVNSSASMSTSCTRHLSSTSSVATVQPSLESEPHSRSTTIIRLHHSLTSAAIDPTVTQSFENHNVSTATTSHSNNTSEAAARQATLTDSGVESSAAHSSDPSSTPSVGTVERTQSEPHNRNTTIIRLHHSSSSTPPYPTATLPWEQHNVPIRNLTRTAAWSVSSVTATTSSSRVANSTALASTPHSSAGPSNTTDMLPSRPVRSSGHDTAPEAEHRPAVPLRELVTNSSHVRPAGIQANVLSPALGRVERSSGHQAGARTNSSTLQLSGKYPNITLSLLNRKGRSPKAECKNHTVASASRTGGPSVVPLVSEASPATSHGLSSGSGSGANSTLSRAFSADPVSSVSPAFSVTDSASAADPVTSVDPVSGAKPTSGKDSTSSPSSSTTPASPDAMLVAGTNSMLGSASGPDPASGVSPASSGPDPVSVVDSASGIKPASGAKPALGADSIPSSGASNNPVSPDHPLTAMTPPPRAIPAIVFNIKAKIAARWQIVLAQKAIQEGVRPAEEPVELTSTATKTVTTCPSPARCAAKTTHVPVPYTTNLPVTPIQTLEEATSTGYSGKSKVVLKIRVVIKLLRCKAGIPGCPAKGVVVVVTNTVTETCSPTPMPTGAIEPGRNGGTFINNGLEPGPDSPPPSPSENGETPRPQNDDHGSRGGTSQSGPEIFPPVQAGNPAPDAWQILRSATPTTVKTPRPQNDDHGARGGTSQSGPEIFLPVQAGNPAPDASRILRSATPTTVKLTRMVTVTHCPKTVVHCTVGQVTTTIETKVGCIGPGCGPATPVPDTDRPEKPIVTGMTIPAPQYGPSLSSSSPSAVATEPPCVGPGCGDRPTIVTTPRVSHPEGSNRVPEKDNGKSRQQTSEGVKPGEIPPAERLPKIVNTPEGPKVVYEKSKQPPKAGGISVDRKQPKITDTPAGEEPAGYEMKEKMPSAPGRENVDEAHPRMKTSTHHESPAKPAVDEETFRKHPVHESEGVSQRPQIHQTAPKRPQPNQPHPPAQPGSQGATTAPGQEAPAPPPRTHGHSPAGSSREPNHPSAAISPQGSRPATAAGSKPLSGAGQSAPLPPSSLAATGCVGEDCDVPSVVVSEGARARVGALTVAVAVGLVLL